ncbi:hypothetical protein [Salinimicrobium terrae]|uniref:hypothetical protein n=1 Tax=Salinimicrobium terrae TaxID=470866 RepID=UPI00048F1139|nr:hypothetical protein [Salinimicrobium terrae]
MKKLKLNYIIIVLGLILVVSCKDEEKTAKAVSTPPETSETSTQAAGNEEIKVNPAHGLPGHDCAVPVGAPLNETAGNTPNPTPTSQLPSTSVSPIRVDQTPNVNPPHGEPGHDCAVPVGAPLNK